MYWDFSAYWLSEITGLVNVPLENVFTNSGAVLGRTLVIFWGDDMF